jgi:putative ABC transport system permease protein
MSPSRRAKKNIRRIETGHKPVGSNSYLLIYQYFPALASYWIFSTKHLIMLKSYFLMAWRNLLKHKVSSFINIGGLAVGLATCILVLLYLVNEFRYDRFHTHISNLYLLMKNQQQADGVSTGPNSAGPMAEALRTGMPEVAYAARQAGTDGLIRVGDRRVRFNGMYADPDLFRMMTFTAQSGDPGLVLRDPHAVVLTESMARRLFGNENAMGKVLLVDDTVPVKVEAILRDLPMGSTIQFDLALSFNAFSAKNDWLKKWDDNRIQTWLELRATANIPAFNQKVTRLLQTRSNDTTVSQFAYPMASLRLYSGFQNGKPSGGRITVVALMAALGLFVLLIACINFMNIATARSEYRAREVGVRKVMGASRGRLMAQFLCEALTITFFALIAGVLLSRPALPLFNHYLDSNIRFDLTDWRIWVGLIGVGLFTGLIAGSYPALFLSRFRPVRVLKGEVTTGRKGVLLRRVLVTAQFWVSIFFIIGTLVIFEQIKYVHNRPIGYDQENLIDVRASGALAAKYPLFSAALARIPGVRSVSAGTDNMLQFGSGITGMNWPGKIPGHEISILVTGVQYNWVRTLDLQLAEGRDFDPAFGTDTSSCLINEITISRLGLKEPVIGQRLDSSRIIGVVKDFVFNNPSGIIAPMKISLTNGGMSAGSHFFVRIRNDDRWRGTIASIGEVVKTLSPDQPFDFSFTKEDYQVRFQEFTSYGILAAIFGGMAIFISCLGLIGLSTYLAERRSKEMSIRKVFGASVRQVWTLLSTDFLRPVLIAFILVVPVALWSIRTFLGQIAYHVTLNWYTFAGAGAIALLIALLTVSFQGIRTALENPAKRLRNE